MMVLGEKWSILDAFEVLKAPTFNVYEILDKPLVQIQELGAPQGEFGKFKKPFKIRVVIHRKNTHLHLNI